jgi:hypothetical protein
LPGAGRRANCAADDGGSLRTTTWRFAMDEGGTRTFARVGPPNRLSRLGAIRGATALA